MFEFKSKKLFESKVNTRSKKELRSTQEKLFGVDRILLFKLLSFIYLFLYIPRTRVI